MEKLHLYNTKTRSVEEFKPLKDNEVGLYTCGPTVYHYAHIGNLRTYVFEDILKRVLVWDGFKVKHVMNVTDVGHLTSDADEGEDKMEKGAKRAGKTVWEVAAFYQEQFFKDLAALNIIEPDIVARATDEIEAQQELIQQLFNRHAAYVTDRAIYFDVTAFPDYWKFSGQKLDDKEIGARDEVNVDKDKRHPADFALWLFTVDEHADHVMRWPSPWGGGFPGWHIECSAISMKYLGEEFDIHTGGVDHIGTHHPNEIAQSEAATGKGFARYWVHGGHLHIAGGKMAKSADNFYRLQTVIDDGFSPIDYRYFCLTAHYRSALDFEPDKLEVAATTLRNLKRVVGSLPPKTATGALQGTEEEARRMEQEFDLWEQLRNRFREAINNDLDIPRAVSVMWEMLGSDLNGMDKRSLMNDFDEVLGLGLKGYMQPELTEQEQALIEERRAAREAKDWAEADRLRDELAKTGVEVKDGAQGTEWTKV